MMTITWQVLIDLLLLLESLFGLSFALLFLLILFRHHLYRKSPLALLVGNSSLAGLLFHLVMIMQAVQMLIGRPGPFCVLRGHGIHALAGAVYHSICIQALHRLFVTVFSNYLFLQKRKTLFIIVAVQWILSLTFCLPKLQPYPLIGDMCLGPFHVRYVFIHLSLAVYLFPTALLVVVYSLILCYIRGNTSKYARDSRRVQHRLRREVSILRRILIPVFILLFTGLPLASFFIQGQFTLKTPPYAVRLAATSLTAGTALSMLTNLLFTDSVRSHLRAKRRTIQILSSYRQETISPTVSFNIHRKSTISVGSLETVLKMDFIRPNKSSK